MSPRLYEKKILFVVDWSIQEYYEHSCYRYEPPAMLIPPS